jgi:ribonuclease P protein component
MRRKSDFARLREDGKRFRTGPITITFRSEGTECVMAYSIPKRVGNAVMRNRLRRRIREIFAAAIGLRPGMYLVSVAPEAATMKFQELSEVISSALEAAEKAEK